MIDGTGKNIRVKGYSMVGKTGTAQKFVDGAYSHTQHVSSFLGFLPAEDPAFVALVMVDAPKTKAHMDYGAQVSAPVFADMSRQIAQILNSPRTNPSPWRPRRPELQQPALMKTERDSHRNQDDRHHRPGQPPDQPAPLRLAAGGGERRFLRLERGRRATATSTSPTSATGAAAVVLENPRYAEGRGPTFIEVPNARRAMATMSASFFGRPDKSLKTIGVTGTNGKTTTTFILKHLLSEPKVPVGLIGTVRYEIGDRILPASRTTPESVDLHGLLAQMKAANCRAAVMEGLLPRAGAGPGRADPVPGRRLHQPDPGPSRLPRFDGELLRGQGASLHQPRPGGEAGHRRDQRRRSVGPAADRADQGRVRLMAYSVEGRAGADIEATSLKYDAAGTRGTLRIGAESYPLELPLLGSYNVANALAAAGAALAFGIPPHVIWERLRTTPQVPGRLEKFMSKDGVTAVVDYAHTDDAVRKALGVLRGITLRRLIVRARLRRQPRRGQASAHGPGRGGGRRLRRLHRRQSAPGERRADPRSHGGRGAGRRLQEQVRAGGRREAAGHRPRPGHGPSRRRGLRGGQGDTRRRRRSRGSSIPSTTGSWSRNSCAGDPDDAPLHARGSGALQRRPPRQGRPGAGGGPAPHRHAGPLAAGDCFVALRGDRFDGHAFVREVKSRGAVAALVSGRLSDLPDDLGLVEVPDTLEALQRFAATYRRLLPCRTVGVTGSSGKTSTKELIAAVLRTRFRTKATEGNLNNHIGVPLTLLRLEEDDEFGVIEMGMNHPGEIRPARAHGRARPRGGEQHRAGPHRIFSQPGRHRGGEGGAHRRPASRRRGHPQQRRYLEPPDRPPHRGAGGLDRSGPESTWRAENIQIAADAVSFELRHGGAGVPVRLPIPNRIMVGNALLAAAGRRRMRPRPGGDRARPVGGGAARRPACG